MKISTNYLMTLLLTGLTTLAITGCSKSETASNDANQSEETPNLTDAMSKDGQEKAAINALPQGDSKIPLSEYRLINDGNAVMFTYYALSGTPPDYAGILTSYSNDYRTSNDEFRKQDLLKALQPKLDQEIAAAKGARYIKVKFDGFRIGKYDFTAKAFPQEVVSNNSNFGWNGGNGSNFRLEFTNGEDFKLLKVSDEAIARTIEEKRSRGEGFDAILYLYAQDVDMNNLSVKNKIMKLSLQDKRGNELLTN